MNALSVDRLLTKTILWVASVVVALAVLLPVGMILFSALRTGTPGSPSATWTAEYIGQVYASSFILRPLLMTLLTCGLGTAIALVLGFTFAWLINRTDLGNRRWLEPAILIPMYFSPLALAIGWVVLGAPRVGLLNILLPFGGGLVNVYSISAIILFIGLCYTPYVYLMVAGSLSALDAGYEDASAILGARPIKTMLKITLPMLRPQLLAATLLVGILSTSMFAEPAIFGARFNFTNLPLAMYGMMLNIPANFNFAAAIGTVLTVGTVCALLIYWWALRLSERFVTTQSRGFSVRTLNLGRWRNPARLVVGVYLAAIIFLPVSALLLTSLLRFQTPRLSWTLLTFDNYFKVASNPMVRDAILNTLIVAGGVATATTFFGFLVAYAVSRRAIVGARALDFISVLPIGLPAVVLSLGFLWAYLWMPLGIYGTLWAVIIAISTAIIPHTIRNLDAALRQLGNDVELAAQILSAGPGRRILTIVLPMIRKPLVAGWLFAFLLTTIQVSVPLVLRAPGQELLSIAVWSLVTDTGNYVEGSAVAIIQAVVAGLVAFLATLIARKRS